LNDEGKKKILLNLAGEEYRFEPALVSSLPTIRPSAAHGGQLKLLNLTDKVAESFGDYEAPHRV